ncbi:MAG TPA: PfkB family carbohydrate kinase [Anaerolineae bacterium]|nr:PfkB family carbohydrate kinase [Anaerolineae bacterium]
MADVDILMVGHFARDQVVVDGQSSVMSGGAVYFGSIALRRLGLQVAVVTRLHADDLGLLREISDEGVQVFARTAAATSGIANYYTSADMERRICRPLGFAGAFRASEVPAISARVQVAASIQAGEIDLDLLTYLAARGPVGLDIQGFVRVREGDELVFRPRPDLAEGLALVTYLKVDRAEAELLTGETDLAVAAHKLSGYGPREIVVTQSSGVTVLVEGRVYTAPFSPRSLEGRTGRGDTCFATYLGGRLTMGPHEATRLAGAVTTLKQEKAGPWRGSLEEVHRWLTSTTA